jgi:hypothetical protein
MVRALLGATGPENQCPGLVTTESSPRFSPASVVAAAWEERVDRGLDAEEDGADPDQAQVEDRGQAVLWKIRGLPEIRSRYCA